MYRECLILSRKDEKTHSDKLDFEIHRLVSQTTSRLSSTHAVYSKRGRKKHEVASQGSTPSMIENRGKKRIVSAQIIHG